MDSVKKNSLSKHLIDVPALARPSDGTDPQRGDSGATPDSPEDLVRREHDALREQTMAADWAEQKRRHAELQAELDDALDMLRTAENDLRAQREALTKAADTLAGLTIPDEPPNDVASLRTLKQALHSAHMELTVVHRKHRHSGAGEADLAALSAGEWTRIGLALTWPLLMTLLLGAGVIAAALVFVFRI